jgi:hypothetical protein
VVDGGIDWFQFNTNPFREVLPVLIETATGKIPAGSLLGLKIVVRSPEGFQVREQVQVIAVNDSLVQRSRFATRLEFSGSQAGLWRVQILAGREVIGDFQIEIRVPTQI